MRLCTYVLWVRVVHFAALTVRSRRLLFRFIAKTGRWRLPVVGRQWPSEARVATPPAETRAAAAPDRRRPSDTRPAAV